MATHPAARYAGPAWLAAGLVVYLLVRRERGAGLLEHVTSTDEQVVPEATFTSILVPMKLGEIGEEMVATAVKLAEERGGTRRGAARDQGAARAAARRAAGRRGRHARPSRSRRREALGADHGVEVRGSIVRARSIGDAIVKEADAHGRGPDRPRLGAALAAPVALLLAYCGLRAQESAVRGSDRRVPARRTRRGGCTRMRDPRDEQYAKLLVETCVDVQPGWQVVVAASLLARPLLDEVCRAIARRGAYALVRHAARHQHDPGRLDQGGVGRAAAQAAADRGARACSTSTRSSRSSRRRTRATAADVEPRRLQLLQEGGRRAMERMISGDVPWVGCQYPTPALAQDAGMTLEQFEEFLYGSVLHRLGRRA